MRASRTPRALWDVGVGVAAALLVFGAVPGVLVGLVGLPLPHHWTRHDVVSWHGLFDLLAVVSWCAWAACTWTILRMVAARVRSGDVVAAVRLSDRIAVRIALGMLALSSVFGLGASIAGASSARPSLDQRWPAASSVAAPSLAPTSLAQSSLAQSSLAASLPREGAPRTTPTEPVYAGSPVRATFYVVRPGDTLASLATALYGVPCDWPAIAAVNLGRLMDDETRFVDPAVIVPGWALSLPEIDAVTRTDGGVDPPAALGTPAPTTPGAAPGTEGARSSPSSVLPLAELAAAGVSALVAGLLARRARQLRRLRAFVREEGDRSDDPRAREAELRTLLAPFERAPLVEMVEVAARHLGDALETLEQVAGAVQWLRAGRDGVEVRFSEPVPGNVRGWRRTGHATWLLPATVDLAELQRAVAGDEPWCAALLPLGDDERGTWLLPVPAGSCVAVIGPRAPDLVRAMRAAATAWSWHEELVVTEDAGDVTGSGGRAARPWADAGTVGAEVLFVGDPDTLSAATRHACAVLTTRHVDADVTVVVDDRAASVHPLGLTVRPPLLGASWRGAVDALTGPGAPSARRPEDERPVPPRLTGPDPRGPSRPPRPLVHRLPGPATRRVAVDGTGAGVDRTTQPDLFSGAGVARDGSSAPPGGAAAPTSAPTTSGQPDARRAASPARARGRAEVLLLATVPGIVGLQAELPAKRARRALELIAYLAVHAPDPVTGATFQPLSPTTFHKDVSGCWVQRISWRVSGRGSPAHKHKGSRLPSVSAEATS